MVAGLAYWLGGTATLLSALFGLALATVFFVVGLAALRLVLASALSMQMIGALAVYAAQVLVLFALLDVLASVTGLQGRPFALGALVGVIAWQTGQVFVLMRRRTLVYSGPMPGETSVTDTTQDAAPTSRPAEKLLHGGAR
ncbi:hypothetical protein GCM10025883_07510 [Mobilicoccus caccae]|uniref:ATP synthase protein I n=1 Tax=Mobilicoccus caccae TaxID=1859295 RepID=A0ABQ6IMQ0_9MICO|nr:hypothetical protein GCM10025883_07510 [Mobilicoccus caccae]